MSKSTARERVKELRSSDLFMTMSEIARKADTSRQRVFQILKQEGLPTRHRIKKILYECPVCGTVSSFKFCSLECKRNGNKCQLCVRDAESFLSGASSSFLLTTAVVMVLCSVVKFAQVNRLRNNMASDNILNIIQLPKSNRS